MRRERGLDRTRQEVAGEWGAQVWRPAGLDMAPPWPLTGDVALKESIALSRLRLHNYKLATIGLAYGCLCAESTKIVNSADGYGALTM